MATYSVQHLRAALVAAVMAVISRPALAQQAPRISIGTNVQVSAGHPDRDHMEIQIAAHPTDPKKLVACSIRLAEEKRMPWEGPSTVYYSSDGGTSWAPTLEFWPPGHRAGDPSCVYGPDGSAFFNTFSYEVGGATPDIALLFRSRDGGQRWTDSIEIKRTDPHLATVDWTTGKYSGRVYVHGRNSVGRLDGRSYSALLINRVDATGWRALQRTSLAVQEGNRVDPGTAAVLSDGRLVIPFLETTGGFYAPGIDSPARANGQIKVIVSTDGGETFGAPIVVSDAWVFFGNKLSIFFSLASDRTSGPFRDRLYMTWLDGRSGRSEIYFAYSTDNGASWSVPMTINDDVARATPGQGPNHLHATVAVSKDGVVGVS